MVKVPEIESILEKIPGYRDKLIQMRERILADAVMIGEIPSPTFGEQKLVSFLTDRFTESQLDQCTTDEVDNATAMLPGKTGEKNILVCAHLDKIWDASIDHTVTVTEKRLEGAGVGDNALGVATLTALPSLLEHLGIELDANLIFLGGSRSMGHGDLGGLRFFVENSKIPIHSALVLEGFQIGRLSYSSLGMNRCEIQINTPEERDWESWSLSGSIKVLNEIVHNILKIRTPEVPKTSIILGSVFSGSSFNVPSTRATLRFEVRSEEPGMVASIREQIEEIVEEINAEQDAGANLNVIARRKPGSIGFSHPLTRSARAILDKLGVQTMIAPSTSELSVLLEKKIPSLTLGISKGENKHRIDESIEIEPIFAGLAQVIGLLEAIDGGICDE